MIFHPCPSALHKVGASELPKEKACNRYNPLIPFTMPVNLRLSLRLVAAVAVIACFYAHPTACAQGVMLRSVGAVNASVGGTATAMPLDAIGALYWNPASISALPKNEMSFGLELVEGKSRVESSVPNPYVPGSTISGSTKGEAGVVPVPSMGLVWSKNRQSPFTFGLGMGAVGGAASLYPHTPLMIGNDLNPNANPVLMDHGRSATVIVLQVTPTVSVQLTERMSVEIGRASCRERV